MKFCIREIFSYPVETEIYGDENDVEIFFIPGAGQCDNSFRIILDRRFFALMGIEESFFRGHDPKERYLLEVRERSIRFVERQDTVRGDHGQGETCGEM